MRKIAAYGLCILLTWLISTQVHAQEFSFQEFRTDEGLRVWMLPQRANTVSLSVHIAIGGEKDPKNLEGLAHFTEHMLFTDNDGRDELEFFKELEKKGGKANGFTERADTFYTVDAPAREVSLALDWSRRLLFDHTFQPEAVEKERKIILLESNLTPLEPLDYLRKVFELLKVLDEKDIWEREFGLKEDDRPVGGTYESVMRAKVEDLQTFYTTNYHPSRMTLFIAGGFDPEAIEKEIRRTFIPKNKDLATLLPQPVLPSLKVRQGYRQEVRFEPSGTLGYRNSFRLFRTTQDDLLTYFFVRDFLREYLNDELRFKGRATYAIDASVPIHRSAGFFSIGGEFAPADYDKSRQLIDETLERLGRGDFSEAEFNEYKDRARAVLDLQTETPDRQSRLFMDYYYNDLLFDSYPDLRGFYASVDRAQVQKVLSETFTPQRQVRFLTFRSPLNRTVKIILQGAFMLAVFLFLRRRWVRPVDLRDLRYFRKFHIPLPQLLVFWALALVAYVFYLEGLQFIDHRIEEFFLQFESYTVHLLTETILLGIWLYIYVVPFTFYPRKILLFKDFILIKFATFRSWKIPFSALERAESLRFPKWLSFKRYGFVWPLAFGFLKPGVLLKAKGRPALFFHTRKNRELLETLKNLRAD